jgi:PAS domain S-box-containing protein
MSGDQQGNADRSAGGTDRSDRLLGRFEHVLDATDTVVWEADLDEMAIESVGPAERVTGVRPETATSPMELNAMMVHPDDQLAVANRFETLLAGDAESVDVEFRTSPENGAVRWVRMQGSVESHEGGQPATLAGLVTDITPLKEREARLDEFAGVVSHDLRNPLSVAIARVELAQESTGSEHLSHARDALNRMEVLIGNLLTLARADRAVGEREPVALRSAVEGAWQTADTAEAELAVETDQTVRADRTRLQQLLENLFRNAVEHGSPAETADGVTVRVGPLEGGFYVEDDGTGIAEQQREALFAGGHTNEHAGLGLRIVGQVVEAHDWSIRAAESDAGGARFEITGVESV